MLTEEEKKKQVVEVISEEDIRIGQKNLDELNTCVIPPPSPAHTH